MSLLQLAGCGPVTDTDAGPGDGGSTVDDAGLIDDGDGDGDPLCDEGAGGVRYEHEIHAYAGTDDPQSVVVLTRDYVTWGVGESVIYEAARLSVTLGDVDVCVTDPAALDYENSHHNWIDRAEATHNGRRYRLEMTYDFSSRDLLWRDELFVYDATSGALLEGPVALTLTGGPGR